MKEVWVFAEHDNIKISQTTFELLGIGSKLASDLDAQVCAILCGHNMESLAPELFAYGASKVYLINSPHLQTYSAEPHAIAISQAIKAFDPEIALFGATPVGRDLAPRLASIIGTGLTADCTGLAIDED
jgi:electron transfer flavoprotein alpha subunit